MQKILAIVGPTAIGKTSMAISLAQELSGEIISGDSMQVYQEVAVGTAKPTYSERQAVKHYLVDTQSIFAPYSVVDFVHDAKNAAQEITKKNKLPILVGGTGFYVNAFLNQMQLGEKNSQESAIAEKWNMYLKQNGAAQLWQQLAAQDFAAACKISPNNSRRVLRALTVIERTGKKFSQQQEEIPPRYNYLIIGLNADRQEIYRRINLRVDQMMEQGLLKEAEFIFQNREQEYQVLQAIGYKEFFPYFTGEKKLAECVVDLKTASRRYAKRQLTYFRHQLPVNWVDPLKNNNCTKEIKQKVEAWLNE
ncbi:tRNA (adenosine(37)-N6)-dimethylallyltransferase MiaA [Lactobacillus sp. ESL0230]|uniref:tRNA (adenosine(37)-N6)-dimethylallyltransferase MiaA n=1 Tax=Lactobacillus sp. ESL0230 TaxID=2069353 RepID=UPI000EFCCDBF|nr:tRNA (adenosine(37)-N6)-dimethylallyltransferase MiaA [Lactobacillus sp. ESL0230]RMC46751.1 tRNA (adenosine(37)-N6)-dimethylallyltransferase MiaA [Lactobacillus sp. ESL0230]